MPERDRLSMRLDPELHRLIEGLAQRLGANWPAAIRWAVWEQSDREGITPQVSLMEFLNVRPGRKRQRHPRPGGPAAD